MTTMTPTITNFDHDETDWINCLLNRKAQEDLGWMQSMFVKHYCKLLDSTIRKHYYDMCGACQGVDGENGKYHICEDKTASLVIAFGGSVLKYATDKEKMSTWRSFLDEVIDRGVFKKVVVKWMKEFAGAKEKIDENRDIYCDFMRAHYPNVTHNPHQEYADYSDSDYDETD